MLSLTDLNKARAIVNASFDTPLIIDRPANANSAWGTNAESYTNIAGGSGGPAVMGMPLEPSTQPMTPGDYTVSEYQQWEIRVPNGTNVQENDRVTLPSGLQLRVQGVHTPMTSYRPMDAIIASAIR